MIGKEGEGKRHWDGKRERERQIERVRERESDRERERVRERVTKRDSTPLARPCLISPSFPPCLSLSYSASLSPSFPLSFFSSLSICVCLSLSLSITYTVSLTHTRLTCQSCWRSKYSSVNPASDKVDQDSVLMMDTSSYSQKCTIFCLLSHLQNDVLPWNWNRMTILRVRFSLVKSKNSVQKDLLSSSILKENKILPIHQTLTWRFWKFGSDPSVPFSCCGDLQIYWKIIEQFFIRQMNYSANIY